MIQTEDNNIPLDRFETAEVYEVFYLSDLISMGVCTEQDLLLALPNEQEHYQSYQFQFIIKLPYNKIWGTQKHRLNSFEVIHTQNSQFIHQLAFGPAVHVKPNRCERTHELYVRKKMKASDLLNLLPVESEPKTFKLNNGLTAVTYTVKSVERNQMIEIIGTTYNLVLVEKPIRLNGFPSLQEIAESIQLIEYN